MALSESLKPRPSDTAAASVPPPEVSVVMPCLNEAGTLQVCIDKTWRALRLHNIDGEIIVADNGSTDGSDEVAASLGARVVRVETKGYGNALRGGIAAARGQYIIMGDADDSYDFSQIPAFLERLRRGFDLVVGNRFQGGIKPGAMRPLHRYFGVPILSGIARLLFGSSCGDYHCGLRGFRRTALSKLGLQAENWEFASEMILKADLFRLRVTELPTTLVPDGRGRPPHLRTWSAGWRHLRLMLLYSPRWLFFYPGVLLMLGGLLTGLWLMPGPRTILKVNFDVHTLLYAATAVLLGFQAVSFALFAKLFASDEGLLPRDPRLDQWVNSFKLEWGLAAGAVLIASGLAVSLYAVGSWGATRFGPLQSSYGLRVVIPAVLCLTLGGHVVLSSFFLSLLRMRRK